MTQKKIKETENVNEISEAQSLPESSESKVYKSEWVKLVEELEKGKKLGELTLKGKHFKFTEK